jgi:hypothetical protein
MYINTVDKIRDEITNKLTISPPPPTEIIRKTMAYVHNNSVHQIDNEHRNYAFNIPFILNKMYLASNGDIKERPHLSCGPRSHAMRAILNSFNIYSRLVQLYSDSHDTPLGHRLLEVFNPDRQLWETWDPDYGVTYVNYESKRPVDILTLVCSDKKKIIPVGLTGIGWKHTETEKLKNQYFKAVLFEQDRGMTNAVIVVNRLRFDMGKIFSSGLRFEEWARKNYGFPRIIVVGNEKISDMKASCL